MDAGRRTINEIFNGSRLLEIPFFQRAYVWGEPQWERLLEDVENICETRTPYFMGSIILKQKQTTSSADVGDIRTVIDGQQRLTTISILLKVLCLKNGTMKKFDKRFRLDDDRPVLQHSYNDIENYNKIMDLDSIVETNGKDNISRAYRFFLDRLIPDKVDFDVICNSLLFVGIDLSAEEDEQQIFDTINSLGVRLTTAELLKNYFFGRDNISDYEKYWRSIFEKDEETKTYWDNEITTGRLRRTFTDLFFFSYLQIRIQDPAIPIKTEDKVAFSKVEKLFDSYKRFIRDYCNNDKQKILDEIRQYSIIFRNAIDAGVVEKELPAEEGLERLNAVVFALDTTTLIPYILFIEQNVQSQSAKNELYGCLETYVMRRLITRATTKNYNQLFGDRLIFNRILSKSSFLEYIDGQSDKINRMPSDDEIISAFGESCLTNKYSTGVLYLIESKIRTRALHSTQLLGVNKYSLEHMMPKKWRNHWVFTGDTVASEARDHKLLTLGNLTIITQSLNASIRDADWKTKKEGQGSNGGFLMYAEGIETLSPYLQYDEWTEDTIATRANDLAQKALVTWPV